MTAASAMTAQGDSKAGELVKPKVLWTAMHSLTTY